MVGADGRMNEQAGDLAGLTQEEADDAGARLGGGARPRREARALPALGRDVRALPLTHRAARSRCSGGARWRSSQQPALEALRERRVRYHPESQHRFAIASLEEAPGLEHLPPALVGAPAADLDVPGRPPDRRRGRAGGLRRVRLDRARARAGRPRHMVLVGAVAVRDARLARGDARARALLPGRRQLDRARDHPPLGEPNDLDGLESWARSRSATSIIHSTVLAPDGRPDVEEPRHRHRPDGADRGVRRRRDALRPPEDLVDAGRALLVRRDRGRAQAREQALERRAADPAERRGRRRPRSRRATSRSGGSSRRIEAAGPRSRRPGRGSTSPSRGALYHLTFDDFCDWYAEAIKPRLYEGDEAAVRPRSAALERLLALLHPVHAARDRGDLVALPGAGRAADRVALARAGRRLRGRRPARSSACRRRRRSSGAAACRSSSTRTTSAASSPPSSGRSACRWTATSTPRATRLRERDRAGGRDARERALRRQRARRRRGRRAREARALPPGTRPRSRG